MKLHPINAGHFKLDGGAMFGVVPKSLWSKSYEADQNNMCSWAMRCLLVEDGNRLVLIDNGMGSKQDNKFFSYYYLHGEDSLDASLKKAGFSKDDITDVFLTHLHFDHCGGSIEWNDDRTSYRTAFKHATYWSNADHWKWATEPNPREKASFLKENILPIQESGQLKFLAGNELFPGFSVERVNGHTDAMMLPVLSVNGSKVMYVADLLPSPVHVPVSWVMAYDTRPLLTMVEKEAILTRCAEEERILFFEHDKSIECAVLHTTEKGVRVRETFPLSSFIG